MLNFETDNSIHGRAKLHGPLEFSWRSTTIILAFVTLVLLGMRQQFNHTITFGYVAAIIVAPLWFPGLRKYRGAVLLMFLGLAALGSGFWLTQWNLAAHQAAANSMVNNAVLLLGLLLAFGVVLWARQVMPDYVVGLAYGLGLLLGVHRTGMALVNPWKFGFSLPIIIILLSLGSYLAVKFGSRSRMAEIVPVIGLAVFSGLNDSRSLFAMLGLALILTIWQLIPKGRTPRRSIAKTVLAFSLLVVAAYEGGTSLLVDGYLGQSAQQRTIAQIDLSGSVLLGGRPEMAASFALFRSNPLGFGLGTVPSLSDIAVAKTGMAAINYQPNNGYVERYMFGSEFELHSTTADIWVIFGIPGLILALCVIIFLIRWIIVSVVHRNASTVVLFLCILTLWNMLFSPMLTSVTTMALALGLAALPRASNRGLAQARHVWAK